MNDGLLRNRTFDQLEIGESVSLVRTSGQNDIDLFAAMSGDGNPAHTDAAFAAPAKRVAEHSEAGALRS